MTKTKGALPLSIPEIEKAKSLSALGRSYRAIARELRRSPHTVKRLLTMPAVAAEISVKKLELSALYENRAYEIAESVTKEDISKASLQQKAVSSAIFLDKSRLLTGQSTSNVHVQVLLDVVQLLQQESDDDLPQQAPRTLTLSASPNMEQPADRPLSQPRQPAQTQTQQPDPAPAVRVRYYTPNPVENEEPYNPLTHGMPRR